VGDFLLGVLVLGYAEPLFRVAFYICVGGLLAGAMALIAYSVWRARKARVATSFGSARWATPDEYREADY